MSNKNSIFGVSPPLPSRHDYNQNNFNNNNKKKWYKTLKFWGPFLSLVILLLCAAGVFAYSRANSLVKHNNNNFVENKNASKMYAEGKPFTIMLLGTDTGELGRTEKGRTDTIMLATLNPKKKTILLTSISRDTMIKVPGYEKEGSQKLNAAYAFGGIKASQQALEKYLNIPIDAYALVNMKGLVKSVDQVGGVKIKSPLTFRFSPETAHEDGPNEYKFTKGSSDFEYSNDAGDTWKHETKMNGTAALAFSRMRYTDPQGDYGRQLRQRMVITALINKGKNMNNILNQDFLNSLSKSVETNLSFDDITVIAKNYHVVTQNMENNYLEGSGIEYEGVDYQSSTKAQKQKITNSIRNLLGLPYEKTGPSFNLDEETSKKKKKTKKEKSENDDFADSYNNSSTNSNNVSSVDNTRSPLSSSTSNSKSSSSYEAPVTNNKSNTDSSNYSSNNEVPTTNNKNNSNNDSAPSSISTGSNSSNSSSNSSTSNSNSASNSSSNRISNNSSTGDN